MTENPYRYQQAPEPPPGPAPTRYTRTPILPFAVLTLIVHFVVAMVMPYQLWLIGAMRQRVSPEKALSVALISLLFALTTWLLIYAAAMMIDLMIWFAACRDYLARRKRRAAAPEGNQPTEEMKCEP